MVTELVQHPTSPDVSGGDQIGEFIDVVTCPAFPGDLPEVEVIGDTVVRERSKPMLIDRVPQTQFSSYPAIEPLENGLPITPFRGRGEPKELLGSYVIQEALVGCGRRVMKFVDDDHIKVVRPERIEPCRIE